MSTPAPAPGVGRHQEAVEEASRVVVVRLRDDEFRISLGGLGARVKDRFLKEAGRPLEWYFQPDHLTDVSMCAFWYAARLRDGEMTLTWDQVLDEWDAAGYTADDIDVREETPGASESPEA